MNSLGQTLGASLVVTCLAAGVSATAFAQEPPAREKKSRSQSCTHTIDCRPIDVHYKIDFQPVRFTLSNSGLRLPARIEPVKLKHRPVDVRPRFDAPKPVRFTLHATGIVITRYAPKVRFSIDETPLPLAPVEPPVVVFHIDDQIKAPPEQKMPVIVFQDPVFPPMPPDPPSLELVCREQ